MKSGSKRLNLSQRTQRAQRKKDRNKVSDLHLIPLSFFFASFAPFARNKNVCMRTFISEADKKCEVGRYAP
ncbi:MAG: hypothetical protein BWK80_12545 [Desulfobacteraceae bacterium IS3]|nr:MAG: hypothetical protein BWK80_12545 [Desulfobacteraceae bacterium IS3]